MCGFAASGITMNAPSFQTRSEFQVRRPREQRARRKNRFSVLCGLLLTTVAAFSLTGCNHCRYASHCDPMGGPVYGDNCGMYPTPCQTCGGGGLFDKLIPKSRRHYSACVPSGCATPNYAQSAPAPGCQGTCGMPGTMQHMNMSPGMQYMPMAPNTSTPGCASCGNGTSGFVPGATYEMNGTMQYPQMMPYEGDMQGQPTPETTSPPPAPPAETYYVPSSPGKVGEPAPLPARDARSMQSTRRTSWVPRQL